jgi:hypothetical protein
LQKKIGEKATDNVANKSREFISHHCRFDIIPPMERKKASGSMPSWTSAYNAMGMAGWARNDWPV